MYVRDVARNQRSSRMPADVNSKDRSRSIQKQTDDGTITEVPKLLRNDGANHELPLLSIEGLDLIMKISMQLDNPDAIDGVKTIRQVRGFTSSSWHRKLEHEHEENWHEALLEYEIIGQQRMVATTGFGFGLGSTPNTSVTKSSCSSAFTMLPTEDVHTKYSNSLQEGSKQLILEERGRLKCLIELGQLHSALDQVKLYFFIDD